MGGVGEGDGAEILVCARALPLPMGTAVAGDENGAAIGHRPAVLDVDEGNIQELGVGPHFLCLPVSAAVAGDQDLVPVAHSPAVPGVYESDGVEGLAGGLLYPPVDTAVASGDDSALACPPVVAHSPAVRCIRESDAIQLPLRV